MKVKPIHDDLPLVARIQVILPDQVHRMVSVLNQELKARGLIFGLRQTGDQQFEFSVYDLQKMDNMQ